MPSVVVGWTGRCPDPKTRYRLLGHLHRLAAQSDAYLCGKQPARPFSLSYISEQRGDGRKPRANIESVDHPISGRILVSSAIAENNSAFADGAREAGLALIKHPEKEGAHMTVLEDARLRGLDFKLFEPRGLYP